MSPVAERIHISKEKQIKEILAPRPSVGAEHAPNHFLITRLNPRDLPEPELFEQETALYLLSHDPVDPLDDAVDGVASLVVNRDGEAELKLEFAPTTGKSNQIVFSNAAAKDVGENFPGVATLRIVNPDPRDMDIMLRFEGIAA